MNDLLTRVDGALRAAVQRVQQWFDPPLDREAAPLEVREAIIEDIEQRVEYDLWYIDNWSFGLDFLIMLQTVVEVMRSRNAY